MFRNIWLNIKFFLGNIEQLRVLVHLSTENDNEILSLQLSFDCHKRLTYFEKSAHDEEEKGLEIGWNNGWKKAPNMLCSLIFQAKNRLNILSFCSQIHFARPVPTIFMIHNSTIGEPYGFWVDEKDPENG